MRNPARASVTATVGSAVGSVWPAAGLVGVGVGAGTAGVAGVGAGVAAVAVAAGGVTGAVAVGLVAVGVVAVGAPAPREWPGPKTLAARNPSPSAATAATAMSASRRRLSVTAELLVSIAFHRPWWPL
jgi:hypothetical protein